MVGSATFSESSREEVTLGDLALVSSIDEVKRVFGEPDTYTHDSPFGRDVLAFLTYEGSRIEYVRYNKGAPKSKYKLRELELGSPDWSLAIGNTRLCPSMPVDQLRPALRQTLDRDFGESVDAFGSIAITKPGTAKQAKRGGELEMANGDAAIQIEVNRDTVDVVRFKRVLW